MDHWKTVTLLIVLQHICVWSLQSNRHMDPRNGIRPEHIKSLHQVAVIKKEIIRKLGINNSLQLYPTAPTVSRRTNQYINKDKITEYKMPEVASFHSEPSENYTDENIVQFRIFNRYNVDNTEINNVNLLVRIKLRKVKSESKETKLESKSKRRHRGNRSSKEISILVSNVTEDGKPGVLLTSVKAKLKKSKSIKLSIPKEIIEKSLKSHERTLQFFIQCEGCDKKTRLILVHKRRQKHMTKTRGSKPPRLHKRRPILYVYSHITNRS